jgi:cytochrome P450
MYRLLRFLVQREWPMRLLGPLFGKWNPFEPERIRDPYPGYRRLRETAPVYFNPVLRIWVVTRYAEILRVLKDPHFSVKRLQVKAVQRLNPIGSLRPDFAEMITSNLLMLDPPDHTRLRGLVSKAFTPRVVERLRPRIQQIVDDLLDAVAPAGEMDLMRDFAYPLPVTVIAEMLGVPASDRVQFRRWANDLSGLLDPFNSPGGLDAAQQAFVDLAAYFRAIFAERRRQPRDDLISALVAIEEQGDRLSEAELISISGLLLGAGFETTSSLLGNAVLALLQHPSERKRLQQDPSLMQSAVEEFLRYESPVQGTDRVAQRDCELGGRSIRAGQLVVLLLGAANRDPERFTDPDRLDVGRTDNAHLAFSQGVHFCLGAQLARVEGQIAIETLLRRFPDFHGDCREPRWRPSFALRGLTTLPISLG